MWLPDATPEDRRLVDVPHGHREVRVARGGEHPGDRPARDRPVREAGVAKAVENERRALGGVGEELLAVAAGGDEIIPDQLRAVLGRWDA